MPIEAAACGADEVLTFGMEAVSQEVVDSSGASVKLPVEAAVCQADEVWTNDLESADIESGSVVNAKIPVLFVPGIVTTELKDENDNLLWLDPLRLFVSPSDDFLDDLMLGDDLLISRKQLELGEVIKKKTLPLYPDYDYTEGLINEFKKQGYVVDEGAEGRDFFTFPYDWRYGVSWGYPDGKTNSVLLKDKIDELARSSPTGKVDVIAHSLGGLVVKKLVMDSLEPKIRKLVFVGVPNLGAPRSVQALIAGTDLGIFGLNPQEFKKISRNLPVSYDLLPGRRYYEQKGSFMSVFKPTGVLGINKMEKLDFGQAIVRMSGYGTNQAGFENADKLRAYSFDTYSFEPVLAPSFKGVTAYNITGCRSATFGAIEDWENRDGTHAYFRPGTLISGDDTVPFESADSIPMSNDSKFYFQYAKHGEMPSADGIRQKIVNIITGIEYPQYKKMITYRQLIDNHQRCELYGLHIIVKSPVDISVVDSASKIILGADFDGNTHYEIPGASFEIMGDRKYLYLPTGEGEQYNIKLKGTDTGTFTLITQKIEGDEAKSAEVFNDIPVTPEFGGSLAIDGASAQIKTDGGAVINSTSVIEAAAVGDVVPPSATATISGQMGKEGFYRGGVAANLSAQDFGQDGTTASGVFSISYSLDGGAATTVQAASTTINIAAEGKHRLTFYSSDKLGNKEEPKTIGFAIDKTPPEINFSFDQIKKDLVFSAADNYSASSSIDITDQNGNVTAADEAGNTTQLAFTEKNRKQSLRAQPSALSYNGETVDLAGAKIAFAWFYGHTPKTMVSLDGLQPLPAMPAVLPKNGPLSFLLQQARLKDGSMIAAIYSGGRTTVIERKNKKIAHKTWSGLKPITFFTDEGKLGWEY